MNKYKASQNTCSYRHVTSKALNSLLLIMLGVLMHDVENSEYRSRCHVSSVLLVMMLVQITDDLKITPSSPHPCASLCGSVEHARGYI